MPTQMKEAFSEAEVKLVFQVKKLKYKGYLSSITAPKRQTFDAKFTER